MPANEGSSTRTPILVTVFADAAMSFEMGDAGIKMLAHMI